MTAALTRRLYVAAWALLGTISLGYFFVLFQNTFQPAADNAVASAAPPGGTEHRVSPPTASTDPGVTGALAHMRQEIDRLRTSLDTANREKAALQAHVRALEATYGPSTASIPPQTRRPRADDVLRDQNSPGASRTGPRPNVNVTMLPMPNDGFDDVIPESPLPIASRQKPRRTQFAVELGSRLTAAMLEGRWSDLVGRHGALLQDLQPHAVRIASARGEKRYSLIAGPFKNAAGAAVLCARLSAAGTTCEGTVFSGKPLKTLASR